MADEDEVKEYRWETGYEKTWCVIHFIRFRVKNRSLNSYFRSREAIKEDDDGLVDSAIAEIILKAKRRRQAKKKSQSRLGMMRHLCLILDCTENMSTPDLKPTRFICTLKLLEVFIEEFFDQNPISQLGLFAMKSKRTEKVTEMAGSGRKHIKALKALTTLNLSGEPSLQNSLELAHNKLKIVPAHASREILIVMGSLTTCDPSDINVTIEQLKVDGIRCSMIHLCAEIGICRQLAIHTGGTYGAVLDDSHFKDQLLAHIDPPPATKTQEFALIKMGFPHGQCTTGSGAGGGVEEDTTATAAAAGKESGAQLTMCMCHIDSTDEPSKLNAGGYHCPQCLSKYCELPVECLSCGLTLVSAPHLARSYHHLFPVAHFKEAALSDVIVFAESCYACKKTFAATHDKTVYQCENCDQIYCVDCDIFVHDVLHVCVGCNTIPGVVNKKSV